MLGDQLQHLLDLGPQLPVLVRHPDPLGLAPAALLRVVAAGAAMDLGVVARVHRGHPHLLAAEPQRRLDGGGVDPAHVVVQDDPAEHPDAGDHPLHQVGA